MEQIWNFSTFKYMTGCLYYSFHHIRVRVLGQRLFLYIICFFKQFCCLFLCFIISLSLFVVLVGLLRFCYPLLQIETIFIKTRNFRHCENWNVIRLLKFILKRSCDCLLYTKKTPHVYMFLTKILSEPKVSKSLYIL